MKNNLIDFINFNSYIIIKKFKSNVIKILDNNEMFVIKLTNNNEKMFLDLLNHDNILNYTKFKKYNESIILFFQFIESNKNPVINIPFIKSLLQTLEYIHFKNIIHCDIKPENIIINENNVPIIIDFGISQFSNDVPLKRVGTLDYISPEIVELESTGGCYSSKVDIWSFGVTIYELLFNKLPFFHENEEITAGKILWGTIIIPEHPFKFLIEKCLDRNVLTRYKAVELISLINYEISFS